MKQSSYYEVQSYNLQKLSNFDEGESPLLMCSFFIFPTNYHILLCISNFYRFLQAHGHNANLSIFFRITCEPRNSKNSIIFISLRTVLALFKGLRFVLNYKCKYFLYLLTMGHMTLYVLPVGIIVFLV